MKKESKYPPGWDEERVRRVISHYEEQSDEEALAEDEAAFDDKSLALIEVPKQLVPAIREMIAKYQAQRDSGA